MQTLLISDSRRTNNDSWKKMSNELNTKILNNNKALFDYWHKEVRLKNLKTISAERHVPTPELRHECTNYDELCIRPGVLALDDAQKSRVITIIKYECTAKALQRRAGILSKRAQELEERFLEQKVYKNKLEKFIRILQQKLFGKDEIIKRLETKIKALETKVEALETGQELETIKQSLIKEKARRERLATNNQKMGGRLSWAKRWKEQRDQYRLQLEQTKIAMAELQKELVKYKNQKDTQLENKDY
tara:strand:+ start:239 stop:979 length:741 start_codon:yes stop_codon:yes gene_type:complete